jgi:hypothetical protein
MSCVPLLTWLFCKVASAFCKGFAGIVNRRNRTKQMFIEVFTTIMVLRRRNLGDEDLQQRCLQFMHRMVSVCGACLLV